MKDTYDILILGGGMAAVSAAAAAREKAPEAAVAMVSEEAVPPYARPMLTKLPMQHYDVKKTLVYAPEWYDQNRIDLLLQTKILSLNAEARTVETSRGTLGYGRCVYALGAYNFIPPFRGGELAGIHDIRTHGDLDAIRRDALPARHAAVIGGGVIGLEAAYLLADHGMEVAVIETAPWLMPRLLDETSSRYLQARMTRFRVITAAKVLGLAGTGRVKAVEVEGMEPISAELVIVSCGVRANSAVAQAAGAAVERAVVVNERMETSLPGVYACGDCAQFQGVNTSLWAQALQEGKVAGVNAAGGKAVYRGSDMALVLNCPEFALYSVGDMGKTPGLTYTEQVVKRCTPRGYEVNPRTEETYEHDFFVDGRMVGTFLLGNLMAMHERHREIFGGQK